MATKAATFSSKIRNLNDYYNSVINCSLPVTNTGVDIVATLKYFSQSLSAILREVTADESSIDVDDPKSSSSSLSKTDSHRKSDNNLINLVESSFEFGMFLNTAIVKTAESPHIEHDAISVAGQNQNLGTSVKQDSESLNSRFKKYPNLSYATLYHSLVNLIEIIPTLQANQIAIGEALIQAFSFLAPFLTDDLIQSLPYTIALTLTTFPRELHNCIMEVLCNTLLPIAMFIEHEEEAFILNSIPSIIMIVFEFGIDTAYGVQIFERLLTLKKDFIQDVLCSIAYGTYKVRYHATNLMFHYWPKLNPNKSDRNIHYRYNAAKPVLCQSERCLEKKNAAIKMCVDPNLAVHGFNTAPPYYMCSECLRELPKRYQGYCCNFIQPSDEIALYCENRTCKSINKIAHTVCYSSPCIISNKNKPITYCKECHKSKHNQALLQKQTRHTFQVYIENIWKCDNKTKTYLSSSIINLLKEVPMVDPKKSSETTSSPSKRTQVNTQISHSPHTNLLNAQNISSNLPSTSSANLNSSINNLNIANPNMSNTLKIDKQNLISVGLIGALTNNGFSSTAQQLPNLLSQAEDSNFNKRLLSRYGCYLIVFLIEPSEYGEMEIFGRIVSMVLEWFHLVVYMPSDSSGEIISKIRTQFIHPWIKSVIQHHFELVTSCFLPFPSEFTQVGGIWETKSNKSTQVKREFSKVCDLITYEIVNFEIWDYVMPYWCEAIINDVSEKHLNDFKSLFMKLFDPDMIPFNKELMYRFVSERFEGTSSTVQEQALSWLQILSELDVSIPMNTLLLMFHSGLNSLQKLELRAMRRREAYISSLGALGATTTSSSSYNISSNNFGTNADEDQAALFNLNLNNNPFTVFDTFEAFRAYRNPLMLLQMTGQEVANLIKEEEEDFVVNNSELNITCCIMMLDMILKQIEIQHQTYHMGIYNPISKELLFLLSKHLILPWAKKHKCKQQFGFLSAESVSSSSQSHGGVSNCQFCEEYVLWFSFAKDVLLFIAPKCEVELPEMNFHQILETISSPTYKSLATKGSSPEKGGASQDTSQQANADGVNSGPNLIGDKTAPKKSESKTDPEIGIWVTSYGVYYFKFSNLGVHLQLFHSLLKSLSRVPDVDAFSNLLICIKLLVLNAETLEAANKEQKGFLIYCLEKLLIPSMWKLLSAEYVHLNEVAVPLIINSIIYESGRTTFWNLVEKDFRDSNWKIRMQAVSRCIAVAQNLNIKQVKSSCNNFSSLSFAFANMIFSIHDIEPMVAQKTITLLETLSDQAIKAIIACFELQFDCVIADRLLLIQIIDLFFSTLSNRNQLILSWDFFYNRFNTLSFENQLNNKVLSPVDISSGISLNPATFQKKFSMARIALKRSDFIKAISSCELPTQYVVFRRVLTTSESRASAVFKFGLNDNETEEEKDKKGEVCETTDDANNLDSELLVKENLTKNETKSSDNSNVKGNPSNLLKNETKSETENPNLETDTIKEQERVDKIIIHSLISLLMKFMINEEKNSISEDKLGLKQPNMVIKHIYSLLKFNTNEQIFMVAPNVLREMISLDAFLSGISMVMDKNFPLGNLMLPVVLRLLRYLPLPALDENISLRYNQLQFDNILPEYTLGALNSQKRHNWLNTFLIILYKYEYNLSNDTNNIEYLIKSLIQIAINTLKFQFHRCEIVSLDLFKINIDWNKLGLLQQETSSFTNDTSVINKGDNEDNVSNKSILDKLNKNSKRLSVLNKKLFASDSKYKSGSPSITNATQLKKGKHRTLRKISSKTFNTLNPTNLNTNNNVNSIRRRTSSETTLKSQAKSKDTEYDATILLNTISKSSKSKFSFNLHKLFHKKNSQSSIKLKKIKKSATKTNYSIRSDTTNQLNPTTSSSQHTNKIILSKRNAKGLKTEASLDKNEENFEDIIVDLANERPNTLYLIMNSNQYHTNEYGLSHLKCLRCNRRLELYNEDAISTLIVICSTFVHRECTLAAPFLIDMIMAIIKIASKKMYSWQTNGNFYFPGNYVSVAKQFLRCVFSQLVRNEIFFQLFQCEFESFEFLETLAISLQDFNELNSVAALRHIIKDINLQKIIVIETCLVILNNVAIYIQYLSLETNQSQWTLVLQEFETLFRQMESIMVKSMDYTCLFLIMGSLLKVPAIATTKTILEAFSKLLCFVLRNCTFKLQNLVDISSLSNRAFTKDRDKQFLPRCIINELIEGITIKINCIDRNFLLMLQFVLLDSGGNIYKSPIIEDEADLYDPQYCIQTNASDSLKQYITEIIAFIADIHTLTRVKSNLKINKHLQTNPSDDSFGAQLKAGLAQFLALEFTELNKCKDRDSRSIVKHLPWLNNLPSNAQQGAKEFVDCIDHIRFLSWLLIGSLTHSGLTRNKGTVISYPIPINCGHYIGEHIFYILNGFTEHSKTSAIHMSSLFHSFILCQLWTMYCEQIHFTYDNERDTSALNAIMEFWTKITPGILQLLSQTKVLADMVILHFLSLIEGLQEYNSLVLAKFFPMWVQLLFMSPLQGDQLKRAKQCLNYQPPTLTQINTSANYGILVKCLQRLQYKVAMIEMQSSNAAQMLNA